MSFIGPIGINRKHWVPPEPAEPCVIVEVDYDIVVSDENTQAICLTLHTWLTGKAADKITRQWQSEHPDAINPRFMCVVHERKNHHFTGNTRQLMIGRHKPVTKPGAMIE